MLQITPSSSSGVQVVQIIIDRYRQDFVPLRCSICSGLATIAHLIAETAVASEIGTKMIRTNETLQTEIIQGKQWATAVTSAIVVQKTRNSESFFGKAAEMAIDAREQTNPTKFRDAMSMHIKSFHVPGQPETPALQNMRGANRPPAQPIISAMRNLEKQKSGYKFNNDFGETRTTYCGR